MKYVRNFDSFRKNKPVNEELLGGLLNWFKKMWDKAVKDLEALKDDPNAIKDWVIKNALNPKDDTNVFSQVLKEFEKKPTANDQDCLTLVDNLLDPETGSLGKQGVGVLLSNKALQGEELKAKRAMLEYIVNTARNQTIAKVKFAGGPTDGKIDPKKKNMNLTDTTHLPDLKKILTAAKTDEKKKRDESLKWVNTVLIPMIQNFVKAIKEDDIRKSLEKQGIEAPSGEAMNYEKLKELYDKKTPVIYLLKDKTKEDWDKLTDDEKKKPGEAPASDIVGVKPINTLNDQNKEDSVTFLDKDDQPIKKGYDDIMGSGEEERSEEAKKAAESLGKIKDDPEKMKIVADVADALEDPKKSEEIKKAATGTA